MADEGRRLALGPGIAGLAAAQAELAGLLEAAGIGPRTRLRVELVVEEAVMNVLQHGQPPEGSARIALDLLALPDHVTIAVEDDGPPFDPLQVPPPPPRRLDDSAVGGAGLPLIRRTARALRYRRTDSGLNRFEMDVARDG